MSELFDVRGAVERAASANNSGQSPIGFHNAGFSSVGRKRLASARHIIGRFLELVPDDVSIQELRDALDEKMPTEFLET